MGGCIEKKNPLPTWISNKCDNVAKMVGFVETEKEKKRQKVMHQKVILKRDTN